MENPTESLDNVKRNPFKDLSLWSLLFSNLVTIYLAVKQEWSVLPVVWVYASQVIIIGLVNFIRIVQLEKIPSWNQRITNKKILSNGKQVDVDPPTEDVLCKNKDLNDIFLGLLFLFVWSFWCYIFMDSIHIDYAGQYWEKITLSDLKYIVLASLVFFINHFFSYLYNKKYETKKYTFSILMVYPIMRTMPIGMTIVFGYLSYGSIFYFFLIKTFLDLFMHFKMHNFLNSVKMKEQDLISYT